LIHQRQKIENHELQNEITLLEWDCKGLGLTGVCPIVLLSIGLKAIQWDFFQMQSHAKTNDKSIPAMEVPIKRYGSLKRGCRASDILLRQIM